MSGEQAMALIRSEILHLKVCGQCVKEASDLGLHIETLDDFTAEPGPRLHAAA